MATQEFQLVYCKGPGGVVEVIAEYDDATGDFSGFKVRGEAGATLQVKLAGVQKSVAFDGTKKSVAAAGSYKLDLADPKKSVFPPITLES